MERQALYLLKSRNLRGYEKKVSQWWILGLLLWLVPSEAYAHDPIGGIITLSCGMIVFFQLYYGITMLGTKRKELETNRFLVSGLYVGLLSILWWFLIFLVPWLIEYIFSGDPFDNISFLLWGILLLLYFVVLPLVAAHLVACGLYRKFREPGSGSETHTENETEYTGQS